MAPALRKSPGAKYKLYGGQNAYGQTVFITNVYMQSSIIMVSQLLVATTL